MYIYTQAVSWSTDSLRTTLPPKDLLWCKPPQPPTHDGPTAPSLCGMAYHSHAYSKSRHFGLSNGPNGFEKLHGGAKLPPRYFWQPGSKKKHFCHFQTNLQPKRSDRCKPVWDCLAPPCIFKKWTLWAFQRSKRIGKTPRCRQVTPPTPLHHGLSKTLLGPIKGHFHLVPHPQT